MKHFVCYLLFAGIFWMSCSMGKRNDIGENSERGNHQDSLLVQREELAKSGTSVQEDFKEFYEHFLQDSVFQVSRLLFPLEGEKIVDDEAHAWTHDNWTLMRASVYEIDTAEYKVEIEDKETMKSFRIYIPDSGFELIMKFKVVSGKWYLFYCKDMFS